MTGFIIRPFKPEDSERLQEIRDIAFRPIHEGFREQLGDDIFARIRRNEEQKQAECLDTFMIGGDRKEMYVLVESQTVAGFVSLTVDDDGIGGEIDLNAIDPVYQGKGGGRLMYQFARVGTGLDSNHAAALKAYEAVGFGNALSWTVLYKVL